MSNEKFKILPDHDDDDDDSMEARRLCHATW